MVNYFDVYMAGLRLNTIAEIDRIEGGDLEKYSTLEDYLDEISDFKKSKVNKLPFVNQERVLDKVVSRLSTSYPHTVLVGEPGIGKTLTLDFLVDIFEGKKDIDNYSEFLDKKTVNTIKIIKDDLKRKEYPDTYLFLPQFDDLSHIRPFTYREFESEQFDEDFTASIDFMNKINNYVSKYAYNKRELLNSEYDDILGRFKSDKVHLDFVSGIEKKVKSFNSDPLISDNILKWMNDFLVYFKSEKKEVNDNLISILDSMKTYDSLLKDRKKQEGLEDNSSFLPPLEDFLEMSPDTINTPDDISVDLQGLRKEMAFMIRVGQHNYEISDLLEDNILEIKSKSVVSKLGNLKSDSYLGIFDAVSDMNPPHMSVYGLGEFFSGPLIYIKDGFKNFLSYFANNGDDTSSKERFLDWLQTGKFELSNDGIKYSFNIPKLIIGSDNEDPFEFPDGLMAVKREDGLESRIKKIDVESVAQSTKKTRAGTLKVIYDQLNHYNNEHGTDIEFSDDVVNYLLHQNHITSNLISLKYRDLENLIKDISTYAQSMAISNVSIEDVKKKKLANLSSVYFIHSDNKFDDLEGYLVDPQRMSGVVNGLAAFASDNIGGTCVKVSSNLIYDHLAVGPEGRFKFEDIRSQMMEETTHKGFSLSKNYLINYLSELDPRLLKSDLGWYVSTQFHKDWGKGGGPSASTVITASIISAMSGTKIDKNRFTTGTLEPNGIIGEIGGEYQKATVPYRFKQLSGSNDEFYFLLPSANVKGFRKELIADPLNLDKNINIVPIRTFAQAYELLSTPKIDNYTLDNSHVLGTKRLEEDLGKIERNLYDHYLKGKSKKFLFF